MLCSWLRQSGYRGSAFARPCRRSMRWLPVWGAALSLALVSGGCSYQIELDVLAQGATPMWKPPARSGRPPPRPQIGRRHAAGWRPGRRPRGGERGARQGRARRQRAVGGSRRPARAAPSRRCRTPTARTAPPAATSWRAMCATGRSPGCRARPAAAARGAGKCARCGPGGGPEPCTRSHSVARRRHRSPHLSRWMSGRYARHEEARRA